MATRKSDAKFTRFSVRVPREEAALLTTWAARHQITAADVLLRCVRAVVTAESPEFYAEAPRADS